MDTPDSVLQSGLGLGPDMGHTILRSMVDPRDYERLRYLQMNGGHQTSFEETIHRVRLPRSMELIDESEGSTQPTTDQRFS